MTTPQPDTARVEALGPAEPILQTLTTFNDHMVHNRPGVVTTDGRTRTGVRWAEVTHKVEDGQKVVYRKDRVGKKTNLVRLGVMGDDRMIRDEAGTVVGRYQRAGLFEEVAVYLYNQVAKVWKLDNEFAARWASYQMAHAQKDLKVVLAAFMLIQTRWGEAERDDDTGEVLFYDDDYRNVGLAMVLDTRKASRLSPKHLLRIGKLLKLPAIAQINRDIGFGKSARRAPMGRYETAVRYWLRFREANPGMLEGAVKGGMRTTVIELAKMSGYKPQSEEFFRVLGWKQQPNAHRTIGLNLEFEEQESWADLDEAAICARIVEERPGWKVLVSRIPRLTQAIAACAIESGCVGDADLRLLTPTWTDLGLIGENPPVPAVKTRWEMAVSRATDMRMANVARNVDNKAVKDALEASAEKALQKAVEVVSRGMRFYVFVDISGSMSDAITLAKEYVTKFLGAFPADRLHVAVFNTPPGGGYWGGSTREVEIKHHSAKGVAHAFKGISAGGGTDYGAGVRALGHHRPADDEDAVYFFIGDQQANIFTDAVQAVGHHPVAFYLLQVGNPGGCHCVTRTAAQLGIPCIPIDDEMFQGDPYAIPQVMSAAIAAAPVAAPTAGAPVRRTKRVSLVETILKTDLLQPPIWTQAA